MIYGICPQCSKGRTSEIPATNLVQVEVEVKMIIDTSRNLDLENPSNFNVTIFDRENDDLIFDTQLKRPGEKSFRPKIRISSFTEQLEESSNEDAIQELHKLVGIEVALRALDELESHLKISVERTKLNLPNEPVRPHMVFTGNPGTGKTTVARLFARRFKEIGLLPKGHLVEADRSTMVSQYIGETAQKTLQVCQRALGGVLFIDEAYSLAQDSERDHGHEAITTLLKFMEDHRGELVVIVAGYEDKIKDFIISNPGLESRFDRRVNFRDYTDDELLKMMIRLSRRKGYDLDQEVIEKVSRRLTSERGDTSFANARTVRKMLDSAILRHSARISNIDARTIDTHRNLTTEDFAV